MPKHTLSVLLLLSLLALFSCSSTKPKGLGIEEGQFKPCPESPNCVSTQADTSDDEHYMAPIEYREDRENARKKLMAVIDNMPRTEITINREDYMHVTFTTLVFRFVDDVEFYFPPDEDVVHFRSASRVGYSDMGANARRMKKVKEKFLQQ